MGTSNQDTEAYVATTMEAFWPGPDNSYATATVTRSTLRTLLRGAFHAGEDAMLKRVADRLEDPVR